MLLSIVHPNTNNPLVMGNTFTNNTKETFPQEIIESPDFF